MLTKASKKNYIVLSGICLDADLARIKKGFSPNLYPYDGFSGVCSGVWEYSIFLRYYIGDCNFNTLLECYENHSEINVSICMGYDDIVHDRVVIFLLGCEYGRIGIESTQINLASTDVSKMVCGK